MHVLLTNSYICNTTTVQSAVQTEKKESSNSLTSEKQARNKAHAQAFLALNAFTKLVTHNNAFPYVVLSSK